MRVALHTPFVVQTNTGIARYILGLLRALGGYDRETEYVCFWPPQAPWPDDLPPNFTHEPFTIAGNPIARVLREQRWIAGVYRRHRFDVLHSPFGYLPLAPPTPCVLTLPDVRVLRFPRTFSWLRGRFLRWAIPRSVRKARLTLAMSDATRQEVLRLIPGVRAASLRVAHPGLDARWFAPVDAQSVADFRQRFAPRGRFLLTVSTWEPHKNLPRLLEAFARLRETPDLTDLRLVLAGATLSTGKSDDLEGVIERLGLGEAVRPLGVVPDEDLPPAYAAAAALAFPSLYEGFGYPPLEAMAVGTPIVTSNLSCMPEIAGDAAELVDPLDIASIAAGLRRVLTDEERRRELADRGRERAARYSWEAHVRQVVEAYRDAAGAGLR